MSRSSDPGGIWDVLNNSLSKLPGTADSWRRLKERVDFASYKPMQTSGIVECRLESNREGEYYILKNPAAGTYLKLTDRDLYLWNLMDGTRTVKELVVAYFCKYSSFAFARVDSLVTQLRSNFFLTDRPVNTFSRLEKGFNIGTLGYRADVFWRSLLNREFSLHNVDRIISRAYRAMGWIFFTRPLKILYILLAVLGGFFFVRQLNRGAYPILRTWNSYGLGFLTLLVIYFIIIAIHETAHAFATKFYGREIRKGGFMMYFGMPAFFVDTMDMWMEPRRARIAVSWAGPYSQLISGGVCSIVANFFPEAAISPLLFKLAFFSYLTVFINLNPLLELDGYFILMDWLEIPFLRRKSLAFVRRDLWPKILRREEFSRDERIFSVFGVLAGAWSVCAIGIALYLWEQRAFTILRKIFEKGLLHKLYLGAVVLTFGVPILIMLVTKLSSVIHAGFRWLADNKYLKVSRNLIALLVGISVGLAIFSFFTPQAPLEIHRMVTKFVILLCALFFAIRNIAHYREGYLERTFQLLSISILFLFAADLIESIGLGVYRTENLPVTSPFGVLVPGFRIVGYSLLLLSTLALAGKNLKLCRRSEQVITLVFLGMSVSLAFIVIRGALKGKVWETDMSPALNLLIPMALALLTVVLLLPGYFVYQNTEFRTAWLALAVALTGMSMANILRFYERSSESSIANMRASSFYILSYALLASAMFGHYIIYTRVRSSHAFIISKPALRYDDRLRLRSAFANICAAIFSQFISIYGERVTRYVQDKLNTRAREAGWELKVAYEKIEDNVSGDLNIIRLGEAYRVFLSQMLDSVSRVAGKTFVEKAVQRGWDGLYWEEREVAAEYLFSLIERGRKLTEELRMAERNLLRMLQEMAIFSGLSQEEIFLISSRLKIEGFRKGAVVVKQGDVGDALYIIKSGGVEVSVRGGADSTERIVAHLGEGEYFGEVALVGDVLRTATCRATTPLEVWALSKRDFNQLARSNLELPERLDRAIVTITMLKRMPLFREFRYKQLNMISSMLKSEVVPPQTVIIREGEPGDAFYIIRSGEVVVTARSETGEETLARLGEAEYFGEIALVSNQPRTATVTSVSETELLVLGKSDFDTVVELISPELEQSGSRRLLDTRLKLRSASASVETGTGNQG